MHEKAVRKSQIIVSMNSYGHRLCTFSAKSTSQSHRGFGSAVTYVVDTAFYFNGIVK